jgi:phosphate transport system substrate-binding protein
MASRKIKADEIGKLSSLGDMTSPANEYVVGLDGIAVIVNQANPVASLTTQQLSQIFSGQVTDWSAVGGRNGSIRLYARDDKSGTFDSFKSMVLGSGQLSSSAKRFEDSAALSDAVAADPNGIGFIGLPYVRSAKAIAVAERGAMPMLPNRFTVATEDYPLSRRLYFYTAGNPQNKYTRKFVQFAISKPGQDIVAENAFVAQTVVGHAETVAAGAPAEYKRLTSGAERLSVDFRFRTGRSDLDNKALVDLDRVIGFVSDLHYSGSGVLLFGFADSTGSADINQKLSLDRAKTVEQQFQQRGLRPGTVRGYGSDLPVASNDTQEGREKNRRVEIWVRK